MSEKGDADAVNEHGLLILDKDGYVRGIKEVPKMDGKFSVISKTFPVPIKGRRTIYFSLLNPNPVHIHHIVTIISKLP